MKRKYNKHTGSNIRSAGVLEEMNYIESKYLLERTATVVKMCDIDVKIDKIKSPEIDPRKYGQLIFITMQRQSSGNIMVF